MAVLNREALLQKRETITEVVSVPELGGDVIVGALNGTERDEYKGSLVVVDGKGVRMNHVNATARLVVKTVRNPDGSRAFSDADVELVGQLPGAALARVAKVAERLSGLDEESVQALGKDSASTPKDASTSI